MNVDLEVSLSEYEKQRYPQAIIEDENVMVCPTTFKNEFMCPICLEVLKRTMATRDCLHRFCYDCINRALSSGNKECPTCRRKLISRRDLRPDPNFDMLISALFPEKDEFQSYQEKILADLNSNKSQQIYTSTTEKIAEEQCQNVNLEKNKNKGNTITNGIDNSTIRRRSLRNHNKQENGSSASQSIDGNGSGGKKQQRKRR